MDVEDGGIFVAVFGPTNDHMEIRHWAESHGAVPTEVMPLVVDGIPAVLRLMMEGQVADLENVRRISWEEFFLKFDSLGLTFVYDDSVAGRSEILQVDEKSPYRNPKDWVGGSQN